MRARRLFFLAIAVIYLTAHSDPATVQRAKVTEPFGYILKPFAEPDLEAHIQVALYKHQKEKEIHQLAEELAAALDQVRVLSGLLPICASCKKIRDGDNRWHRLESYIESHSEAQFTHGVCPDCRETLYAKMKSA